MWIGDMQFYGWFFGMLDIFELVLQYIILCIVGGIFDLFKVIVYFKFKF